MHKLRESFNHLSGIPVTVAHRVPLGVGSEALVQLRSSKDWQVLRDASPRYRVPETREAWLAELVLDGRKDGQDPDLLVRVDSLARLLEEEGIETFYSIGAGGGVFEYYLKQRMPGLRVIATEYAPEAVERLKRVFLEANAVERFDAKDAADWKRVANAPASVAFINRNEREFTDVEWRQMFADMQAAGVQRVFLGLMYTWTVRGHLQRVRKNFRTRLAGGRVVFAGYLRNFTKLSSFWEGRYRLVREIPFPTCRGIYLTRI